MPSAKFYSFFVPFAALLAINVLEPVRHVEMTAITAAVASEAPAASAPTQEPLSIKDRDIRKAARLVAAIMICDPISGKGSLGLELKVEHAYGKEAAERMMDVYREILTDIYSKARASEAASIAANGIFAKPKFNACEEAKRLASDPVTDRLVDHGF